MKSLEIQAFRHSLKHHLNTLHSLSSPTHRLYSNHHHHYHKNALSCSHSPSLFSSRPLLSTHRMVKALDSDMQIAADGFSQPPPNIASSDVPANCPSMGLVLPATQIHVPEAVSALRSGQVIAVPTDTLYGLAADACSSRAIQKIYEIKGRSSTSPLAVCVAQLKDLEKYSDTSHLPKGLLKELLPGPVTLVLQRGEQSLLEKSLNPGLTSIGIRIPDSSFIRQVAQAFGGALALTSANPSSQPSTVRVEEFKVLWIQCAYVFDAGEIPASRAGSTIIDLTIPEVFKILRRGSAFEQSVATLEKFGLVQASITGN